MTEESKQRNRQLEKITGWLVSILIAIGTVLTFLAGNAAKGSMGLVTIIVLIGILVYQSRLSRPFPASFTIIIYVFVFVSVGLGTLGGFYRIPHFDDALHLLSGVWIGYGGLILLKFMVGGDLAASLPKAFVALYIISFALATAGLWELFEFAGDKWFHFTAQGRDHEDTMFDMFNGLTGGILAAVFFWRRS